MTVTPVSAPGKTFWLRKQYFRKFERVGAEYKTSHCSDRALGNLKKMALSEKVVGRQEEVVGKAEKEPWENRRYYGI